MKRYTSVIGSHTGLWTMMLSAGVLAVLLACVGAAAGATTRVVGGDGGGMSRLRSVMMVAVALVLAAAGVVAAMPPVPYFSQYDSLWSNDDIYVEYSGGVVSAEDAYKDFTGSVADAKIQAAFAEDKIQSLSTKPRFLWDKASINARYPP